MLSERQASLLKILVGEYVASASPVGSSAIVKKYGLPVSSATVRNEMAELEESGFVTHPHTSAGRVPSDRGYRYYVQSLPAPIPLASPVQRTIRQQFHQVELEVEEWSRLAASVLAQLVQNAALVTTPKASDVRLRHLELVELHASLAMLILVLREARVKQQMVTLARPTDPNELHAVSVRLNQLLAGGGPREIAQVSREVSLTPLEQQIPIVFKLLSTAEPSADGGFTMHWSVRPLDYLDRKSEITIDGVLQEVDLGSLEVNATGGMTQQLPSLTITGKANPFTGRDITAAVKFTGSFCEAKPAPTRLEAPNFYCGTLAGNITSPLVLSLDGSFYTIERIVDGVIPSPVIVGCDGLEANPPKPL